MWNSQIKRAWRRQWRRVEQTSRAAHCPLKCPGHLLQTRHRAVVVAAAASGAAERPAEVRHCCPDPTKAVVAEPMVSLTASNWLCDSDKWFHSTEHSTEQVDFLQVILRAAGVREGAEVMECLQAGVRHVAGAGGTAVAEGGGAGMTWT